MAQSPILQSAQDVPLQVVLIISIVALPVNSLVSALATLGEEIGWRGWLLPNLRPLGTWPALLLSGVIWGVWHAPLILLGRSEEHTSELQSRFDLVCRLLLEKKKKKMTLFYTHRIIDSYASSSLIHKHNLS